MKDLLRRALFRNTNRQSFCILLIIAVLSASTPSAAEIIQGGPLHGTNLPDFGGGMVVGGPFNGTILPGREGGMIVGGPLNGTVVPSFSGGMIVGSPLNGTILPAASGGVITGGPFNGSQVPGHNPMELILLMYLQLVGE